MFQQPASSFPRSCPFHEAAIPDQCCGMRTRSALTWRVYQQDLPRLVQELGANARGDEFLARRHDDARLDPLPLLAAHHHHRSRPPVHVLVHECRIIVRIANLPTRNGNETVTQA